MPRPHGENLYCPDCGREARSIYEGCSCHVVITSAKAKLLNVDIWALDKNADVTVRLDDAEDAEVKRLYLIWKSL